MKSRITNNKGQAGFSLVELMVVVGIIGLLVAIAVPQFQKFQARARQSEAKAMLSTIFTSEKAFFSEWNGYSGSMANVGAGTVGNKIRYDGGIGAACLLPANYPPGAPADGAMLVVAASNQIVATTAVFDLTIGGVTFVATAGVSCSNGVGAAAKTFLAGVVGEPNNTAAAANNNIDRWTISDLKVITNVQNGIR